MSIIVKKADLTKFKCDAIVNPANSYGYMGGGVAGAIKRVGGYAIEKEAVSKAPIRVGNAISTTAGSLPCRFVIHAPTMKQPAMRIDVENVRLATKAALEYAVDVGIKTIAIPGMGTGVGGVSTDDAAKEIVCLVKEYENMFVTIYLIDRDNNMIKSFKKYLEKK